MRLVSLKLENIRSYLSQRIDFPEGSLLLAGDIGSGKSTILLAIEFALFGIMHGTLSGDALLRNGKKEGSVELRMVIDNQDVIIKRFLKRNADAVVQQSGYIVKNEVKREATPLELKSEILSLLGYPKELLTKSKNLIYRYTVYTPQEEMKHILREDKEQRLDILRRLFGIDKYKRVRENTQTYLHELREKSKVMEGKIADLEEKKRKRSEAKQGLKNVEESLREARPKAESKQREVNEQQKKVASAQGELQKCQETKHSIELQNALLRHRVEQQEGNARELANLTEQVDKLREELKSAPQESLEVIQRLKKEKEGLLGKREEALNEARARMAKLRAELENSLALQKDISKMDSCPVCLQRVGETHKRDIHEREDRKVESCRKRISDEELVEKKEKSEYLKLKQEVEQITGSLYALELFQVKSRNVNEKEKRLKELLGLKENAKKEIGQINARKLELQEELKRFEGVEKLCEQEKKQLDSLSAEERRLTMELTRIEAEHKGLKREIESMEQEIEAKMLTKKNLEQAKKLQHWLESFFMNLMIVMEKHVMGCVHGEFNEVFQQWFKMLIEDEVFNVRLDDEFTPVVEQNGYEIEIENLSGGEKASCALAYRLALNKVVNEFISTIKTRNLIILDEPTDGFSTEQLDRVRDVLAQLKLPQVIIVSHESKIESFVDNLIRVRKEEHVSVLD